MAKKSKDAQKSSHSMVDLGEDRKNKIARFRGKMESNGRGRLTLPMAINMLLDKALELEQI